MGTQAGNPPLPHGLAELHRYTPADALRPHIDRAEMLRYLGYNGQELEVGLAARIERVAAELERTVTPRGIWQVFPVDAQGTNAAGEPCIRLAGTTVELDGRDIFRHLKDAQGCALLAATLGMESERRLRTQGGQSPLDAALLDAACSAYIEAAVDAIDSEIEQLAATAGFARNSRFSCGYGDCPLEAQDAIVTSLNAGRLIGLTVTPTHLLLPSKSVTAMIGLFAGKAPTTSDRPTCAVCRLAGNCSFRTRGTTCYGRPHT